MQDNQYLNDLAEKIKDFFHADLVEIYEYFYERQEFVFPPVIVGEKRGKFILTKDNTNLSCILRKKPFFIDDTRLSTSTDKTVAQYFIHEEILSTVIIPIINKDEERMGLMFINYRDIQNFTSEKRKIISFFTEQMAIAIKNMRLYSVTKQKHKALINIGNKLAYKMNNLKEDDIFQMLYKQAIEKLGMSNLSIALYNNDTDEVKFVLASEDGKLQDIKEKPNLGSRKGHNGKTEEVIHSKKYLYHSQRYEVKQIDSEPQIRTGSWLGVPMRNGEKILGVIATYDKLDNRYNHEDIEILQTLADQAAVAIENIRLLQVKECAVRLTEELNLLRTLIDNMPDYIYIKDPKSRFILANNRVAKFMGEESWRGLIGKTDHDFYPKDLADEYRTDEENIVNSLEPMINKEERSKHLKTNEWIWLLTTKVPFKDTEGKVAGILGINRDITEIKRSQKIQNSLYEISEAAHTTENLQDLYPKIHKIIGKLMPAKNFYVAKYQDDVNDLAFVYFCNQKTENPSYIKKSFTGYILRTQQPLLGTPKRLNELTERGEVTRSLLPCESLIGVPLKIESRAIGVLAVYSYENETTYSEEDLNILIFVSSQIAMAIERVRAQEELNKKNQELQKQGSQHKALIDLAQRLTSSIQLKEKDIFEIIKGQLHGLLMEMDNIYIALYDEANDFVHFPLAFTNGKETEIPARKAGRGRTEEIIRTKAPVFIQTRKESEEWYKQPGRSEYMGDPLASWLGVPMMIGEKVLGVVATYHPTKDYVYTKDDLEILQAMADIAAIALNNAKLVNDLKDAQNGIADRERQLVKSGFAMDFTHKMNNLAGTIPAWISLIKRKLKSVDNLEPKVFEYLDKINKDIGLLLNEAHELRNPNSKPEKIDMEEVVGAIVAQVEMMILPDIKIVFNDPDNDLFPVYGVKEQIAVAIYSVIHNGVKAISGQGKIAVDIKNKEEGYIEIDISDTGCGISQDKIDSIFEYGKSFWTDKKGTGYGLWRARSIIQSMNGNIKVTKTKEGEGTTFTITLPIE